MNRFLVMLSGGIDSAVALAWAHLHSKECYAISFTYHLRPFRERLAVYRLLQTYPSRLLEIPVPFIRELSDHHHNSQPEAPEGYISNRNLIFYSIASHFAETFDCETIVGGHNAGDREDFPDASPEFFSRLQDITNEALLIRKISIELPLKDFTKRQVVQKAIEWKVPLEHTWSCYWDQPKPCGSCSSCKERAESFRELAITDPLG